MIKETLVFALVLAVLLFATNSFSQEISWHEIGGGYTDFSTVLIDPDDPRVIYAGQASSIIKTQGKGNEWKVVLNIRGQNRRVNSLVFGNDNNSLYAASGNGLYYSADKGVSWKRIFGGKDYLEKDCTSLVVLGQRIYLGTKSGLFVSFDNGRSWQKETTGLGNVEIYATARATERPGVIYVVTVKGVFKTQNFGQSWSRIFSSFAADDVNGNEEECDESSEEGSSPVRSIVVDPGNPNNLYLATSRGIFESKDEGQTLSAMPGYGLLSSDVDSVFVASSSLVYAVTKSGIFEYNSKRWREISIGLAAAKVNFLSMDTQNYLYAACNNGLFLADLNIISMIKPNSPIDLYCKDEPAIGELQSAAIRYAEVEPEKIKKWREKAAKKALLPQLSIGLDRNATDLWHWEGGSTTKSEDDLLRRGRDSVEWDVNLSWDLSELIWNNDQTSIDARSRLMVQLRDDILDEVTKIYFERIRLKMEMDNVPIEDRRRRLEKELRLRELAASLDALTGGYFSKKNPDKSAGNSYADKGTGQVR